MMSNSVHQPLVDSFLKIYLKFLFLYKNLNSAEIHETIVLAMFLLFIEKSANITWKKLKRQPGILY